jgi:hypothetical protein
LESAVIHIYVENRRNTRRAPMRLQCRRPRPRCRGPRRSNVPYDRNDELEGTYGTWDGTPRNSVVEHAIAKTRPKVWIIAAVIGTPTGKSDQASRTTCTPPRKLTRRISYCGRPVSSIHVCAGSEQTEKESVARLGIAEWVGRNEPPCDGSIVTCSEVVSSQIRIEVVALLADILEWISS